MLIERLQLLYSIDRLPICKSQIQYVLEASPVQFLHPLIPRLSVYNYVILNFVGTNLPWKMRAILGRVNAVDFSCICRPLEI